MNAGPPGSCLTQWLKQSQLNAKDDKQNGETHARMIAGWYVFQLLLPDSAKFTYFSMLFLR